MTVGGKSCCPTYGGRHGSLASHGGVTIFLLHSLIFIIFIIYYFIPSSRPLPHHAAGPRPLPQFRHGFRFLSSSESDADADVPRPRSRSNYFEAVARGGRQKGATPWCLHNLIYRHIPSSSSLQKSLRVSLGCVASPPPPPQTPVDPSTAHFRSH